MSGSLWSGRLPAPPDPLFFAFARSLPADLHLFPYEIRASIAHVHALARAGVLAPAEAQALEAALADLLAAGPEALPVRPEDEDLHTTVERVLTERLGELGQRLHTGRSRNDQVATDAHLYAADRARALGEAALDLAEALLGQAEAAGESVVFGTTHLQPAQPILLAHHLLAYGWMALRDAHRFTLARSAALAACPLGAGALAGTAFPLDVAATATELGFAEPYRNSLDAVSDRDFLVELAFACALTMVHLSRLAEELVLWSAPEFGRVRLADGFSTGSSMMPQKRNPDAAELVRGKAGAVFGHLQALLATLKGLPLAYMRDLQEDKAPVYAAVDTTLACLRVTAATVASATFHAPPVPPGDATLATDLADLLVRRGLPFRAAHAVVAGLVRLAEARGVGLADLTAEDFRAASPLFPPDLGPYLDPAASVARRDEIGGTSPRRVAEEKAELARRVRGLRDRLGDPG